MLHIDMNNQQFFGNPLLIIYLLNTPTGIFFASSDVSFVLYSPPALLFQTLDVLTHARFSSMSPS